MLLRSTRNVQLVDSTGSLVYHSYLKAPGRPMFAIGPDLPDSRGTTPGSYALAVADYTASRATASAPRYTYIRTSDTDSLDHERFHVVRIDNDTGREAGRVQIPDGDSRYVVEPNSSIIVVRVGDRVLEAHKFGLTKTPPAGAP